MNYESFQVREFVMDEYFQRWILTPDAETEAFWRSWLEQHPDQEETILEAKRIIQFINFREDIPDPADQAEIWSKIQAAKPVRGTRRFALPAYQDWHRWAAAFAGLLLVGSVLFLLLLRSDRVTYANAFGETRSVQLPDGSTVVLNANSELSFSQNWQDAPAREVWLEGEAFFSVRRNKVPAGYRKFIVHTRNLQVEVLGTEFNVAGRKASTQVVLSSGKVKLDLKDSRQQSQIFMQPGELVEYSDGADQVLKKRVNPRVYSSWTEHKWILDHTSLAEVAERIEATFGVTVTIRNEKLGQTKVVGVIPTGDLDTLLKVLSATLDIHITQRNKQVIIAR
jgi:ferric-dicitrate binding protein FerR (iron transport regulator)